MAQALESVLSQTCPATEIIVVDNLSTDGTKEIVSSYGDRIKFMCADKPGPPGYTRNMGIEAASGEYIAFLDSDDAWYPQKLEKQIDMMQHQAGLSFCHTYCDVINEHSRIQFVRHLGAIPPTGEHLDVHIRRCLVTLSSMMVRRDVLVKERITFPTGKHDWTGEEYLFALKLMRNHPIGFIDQVLTQYRSCGDSISGKLGWKIVPRNVPCCENILRSPEYWSGLLPRRVPLTSLVDACVENSRHWRGRGYPSRALWFCGKGLFYSPGSLILHIETAKSLFRGLISKERNVQSGAPAN